MNQFTWKASLLVRTLKFCVNNILCLFLFAFIWWLCCNIKIFTFSLYCYYFHVKLQLSNGILCIILFSLIVASDFICKICYKCTKYVIRIKYIVHVLYLKHFSNSETDTCTLFEVYAPGAIKTWTSSLLNCWVLLFY